MLKQLGAPDWIMRAQVDSLCKAYEEAGLGEYVMEWEDFARAIAAAELECAEGVSQCVVLDGPRNTRWEVRADQ